MRMYFDTETTGVFSSWQRDFHNYKRFPAIMSYAHVLTDDDWNVLEEFHSLVKIADDVEVHPKAQEVHGISREICMEKGINLSLVLTHFFKGISRSRMVIGFNTSFDLGLMEISKYRAKAEENFDCGQMELPQVVDLMKYAEPICAIPATEKMRATGRHGFKPPRLSEALKIICDYEHVGAHDALADVKGCVMLHKKLVEMRNA